MTVSAATEGIYTYTVSNGETTITDCDKSVSGSIKIPSTLGGYPVTGIGKNAFTDCAKITVINIPEGVTEVGYYAFSGCTGLISAVIPETVTSYPFRIFQNCTNLKIVEYYGRYYELTGDCFIGCDSLETVICPNIYQIISYFKLVPSLKKIDCRSATTIEGESFKDCELLEEVICSPNKIGDYAFSGCEKLKKFFVASHNSAIGKYAFYGCSSLEDVSIPCDISISDNAFAGCTNLDNIYISSYGNAFNYSDKISDSAFWGVDATVHYPKGINLDSYYSNYGDFGGSLIWKGVDYGKATADVEWEYDSLTDVLTFSGIGKISSSWFSGNETPWSYLKTDIKKVIVQYGITDIGSYIFEYLSGAEEIILPDSLETIAYNAFNDCTSLNNLVLPKSLKKFTNDDYGFLRCTSLTDVYYIGTKEEFSKISNYAAADNCGQTIHYLVWNESTETCTEPGFEGYYSFDDTSIYDTKYDADKNVKTYLNSVSATGHNIVWMKEIPSNCHKTGKKERFECKNCGICYTSQSGTTERADYIIEVDNEKHEGGTELKNSTDGYTGDKYCLGCNEIISYGENIYKIKVTGVSSAPVGSSDILSAVEVGTNKDVNTLYCVIRYPESLTLKSITAKDFAYVSLEEETTQNGFTTAVVLAQYSETELIPKNEIHTPFEMTFNVSKSASTGTVHIEATEESCLIGNESYFFEERIASELEITPKLAESIEIIGEDVISSETTYTAIILPDYCTSKVEWSVDDETIATVDEFGKVTPIICGTIVLTATAKDGSGVYATKSIDVNVSVKANSITSDVGVWDKTFDSDVTNYTINVNEDVDTIYLTTSFVDATAKINGFVAANGVRKKVTLTGNETFIEIVLTPITSSGLNSNTYTINVVRGSYTKTSISEDGKMFNVTPINIENGKTVMLALYNGNKFIEIKKDIYEGKTIPFQTTGTYTKAKVFVWSDLDTLMPLCVAEIVKIK